MISRCERPGPRRSAEAEVDGAGYHVFPGDDLDVRASVAMLAHAGHDPSFPAREVCHRLAEAADRVLVHGSKLDLDGDETSAMGNEQIDLGAGLGAPEEKLRADDALASERDDFLDDETLEGVTSVVPGLERLAPIESRQGVQEAGVPDEDLRALGQALLDVGVIRRQTAEQEHPLQHVNVVGHRGDRHAERAGQIGNVEKAAVDMGEHGGQTAEPCDRQADPQWWQVALEQRREIAVKPLGACAVTGEGVDGRESTPEPPVRSQACPGQLDRPKRRQLEESNPARQRLRGSSQKGRACRAGENDPSLGRRAIEDVTQDRKQLGQTLGLIEHDVSRMRGEEHLGVGIDQSQIPRPFQIEVEPIGKSRRTSVLLPA